MISAHDLGSRQGRPSVSATEQLLDALDLPVDYVEFDVQRTADGEFVLLHDHHVDVDGAAQPVTGLTLSELRGARPGLLTYAEALAHTHGRTKAHLDFKFASPPELYDGSPEAAWEVAATRLAVDQLGENLVITTGEDRGVQAVRRWADTACPSLLVGLSLGRSRAGLPWRTQLAGRLSELFPARRVAACNPDVIVANRWLATFGVARWTSRRGLLLLVWTVDDRRGLRRWLSDPRCWMVTTNNVRDAVRIKNGYRD